MGWRGKFGCGEERRGEAERKGRAVCVEDKIGFLHGRIGVGRVMCV
jgi:hypothetical protein